MKIYNLKEDIALFGFRVKTFPAGVGEAFEKLAKTLPDGFERSYYGISYFDKEGVIVYNVTAEEKYKGEGENYNYEHYIIKEGEYLMAPVKDWRKNMNCIKDVFHEMMNDNRVDANSNCVEWYKDDDEMWCMMRTKLKAGVAA